jgi:hypothetical protein
MLYMFIHLEHFKKTVGGGGMHDTNVMHDEGRTTRIHYNLAPEAM